MRILLVPLFVFGASTASLAAPAVSSPRIVVLGIGTDRAAPEVATLTFDVRGEGKTSDAAARALVAKRRAIEAGLASLPNAKVETRTGDLAITEARGKSCDEDEYDDPPLSTGDCAVQGYIAKIDVSVRMAPVEDAGRALALVAGLGATDASLSKFEIIDRAAAQRRATAAALTDARARAEVIASGSGRRLGALLSVEDEAARDRGTVEEIVVTGTARHAPPPPPAMIDIEVAPRPIETNARLVTTFAIEP